MCSTDAIIILYGSATCAILVWVALTLKQIHKRLETFYNDAYYHIHKDRYS